MEGCSDGTYQQTKQKFFSCPYGKGLYYPFENLQPDERYAVDVSTDGNREKFFSLYFLPLNVLHNYSLKTC